MPPGAKAARDQRGQALLRAALPFPVSPAGCSSRPPAPLAGPPAQHPTGKLVEEIPSLRNDQFEYQVLEQQFHKE